MSDDRDWIDELYAEGREEPPAELDAAVLAAARDNATRPWYRNVRRLATLATAASFLLAALVVIYDPAPERRNLEPAKDEAVAPGITRAPASPTAQAPATRTEESRVSLAAEPPAPAPSERNAGRVTGETAAAPAAGVTELARQARKSADYSVQAQRLSTGNEAATRTLIGESLSAAEPKQAETADATEADRPDAVLDSTSAAAALEARCGALPGTAGTRTLATDSLGWYVAVRTDEDTRYYRCDEEAWRQFDAPVEAASEKEEPDTEHDE